MTLANFYERLSESHHDSTYYLNPVGIERRNMILSALSLGPLDKVCDVGCGDGMIARRARGQGREVFGVDLSLGRVKRAVGEGVQGCVADAMALPFPTGSFDRVICTEVIEHVPDPSALAGELKRVLRVGGIGTVSSPYEEKLEKTLNDIPDRELLETPYEELLEKYGLHDTHLSSFTADSLAPLFGDCEIGTTDYTHDFVARLGFLSHLVLGAYRRVIAYNERIPRRVRYHRLLDNLPMMLSKRIDQRHHIVLSFMKT